MEHVLSSLYLLLVGISLLANDRFVVANISTDHMILQRNVNVKVRGEGADGSSVEVHFEGQNRRMVVAKGKWMVELKTGETGGPYKLEVVNGNHKICFRDVFVGDVWLAGGQSNMEFAPRRVEDAQAEIPLADYPQIRYYKIPRRFYPEQKIPGASWKVCSPETATDSVAIAYYLVKNIHKELSIPIDIIQVPVGGTTVEAWTNRKLLMFEKDFRPLLEYYDSIVNSYRPGEYEKLYSNHHSSLAEYNKLSAEKERYINKPSESVGKWNFRRPVGLSETMLSAACPYTLEGFILYQGESNTARGAQYRKLFLAMIKKWRTSWGQGDIPFLFVRLPRFETKTHYWNELREAQYLASLRVKNTGMAVAFDQGNPKDIHPIVKDTVGWRLAQSALGKIYGRKIIYQGPEFKKLSKVGNGSLLLDFINTGTGIIIKDEAASLSGLTVAGRDGKFYPTKAVIVNNNQIRVSSEQMQTPIDVRYLWVDSVNSNFFNKEGFPAYPFRIDSYRLETEGVYVNPEPVMPKLDLFLPVGQSNMAGRGYITDNYKNSIKDMYLLTPTGTMERARNPLNKYSTIRKRLDLQGVGPAYSFAKAITKKTEHQLGLVVSARSGSSINSWLKGARDDYYGEALSRIRQTMEYGKMKAIIWHQGRSDSREPGLYMEKLKKLAADLRQDLGDEKLPVMVDEIADWRINGTSEAFNKVLRTVPQHISYAYCVSSRELVPLIDERDPHFSADSQIILGRGCAETTYEACYS